MLRRLWFQMAAACVGAIVLSWNLWRPLLGEHPLGPPAESLINNTPASSELICRNYNIRDLLREPPKVFPTDAMAEIDADQDLDVETRARRRARVLRGARQEELFAELQREIDPASWKAEGSITVLEWGTMSVDQSPENQHQVGQWLARKRWLPGAEEFMRRMRWMVGAMLCGVCVMHYSLVGLFTTRRVVFAPPALRSARHFTRAATACRVARNAER